MLKIFSDIPESIYNISEIIDKVESFDLAREVLLPDFKVPEYILTNVNEPTNGSLATLNAKPEKGSLSANFI